MWPSRTTEGVADVKVALPPPLGALDLRDKRFQIGSAVPRSSSYTGELNHKTSSLAPQSVGGVSAANDGNQPTTYRAEHSSSAPSLLKPSHSSSSLSISLDGKTAISIEDSPAIADAQPLSKPTRQSSTKSQDRLKSKKDERRQKKRHYRARTMDPPVLSFYGAQPVALQSRFATIKRRLIAGHEKEVAASWARLIVALNTEMAAIRDTSSALELMGSIDYADIENPDRIAEFSKLLKRFGVGVVRGVVPPADAEAWVEETRSYLETKHDIKPPPPQDPTCFDFFWTPAQIRARAHPHVLRAMKFAMGLWDSTAEDRMATRFPITYADRIRIHVNSNAAASSGQAEQNPTPAPEILEQAPSSPPLPSPSTATGETSDTIIAQVDGGSLERWEPDGYGRSGTYDSIFRGDWESYDPWDAAGRISATPDLYNGAGACSIFRMFQGLVALTQVQPGMIRLLPSPKLVTAYFLLRPFFSPKKAAPEGVADHSGPDWDEFLHPDNWELDEEQTTIIHGAVPGHAQRVTELWHPHLDLQRTLVTPPDLQAGDYIIWHCETAYTITSSPPVAKSSGADGHRHERFMVYAPACPLTQTNALYMARQRKNFLRGHPGPDFDSTGTGLGTEAPHVGRLGEKEIREVGGEEGLRAMGLTSWDDGNGLESDDCSSEEGVASKAEKMDVDGVADDKGGEAPLSAAEVELVRLANIILFPDKYEFYMATRHSSPDGGRKEEVAET